MTTLSERSLATRNRSFGSVTTSDGSFTSNFSASSLRLKRAGPALAADGDLIQDLPSIRVFMKSDPGDGVASRAGRQLPGHLERSFRVRWTIGGEASAVSSKVSFFPA